MINLGQLRCFWAVAKAGGVHRASENLHLTPQTLSGQVSRLEETLGVALFNRVGRRLELTETGKLALSYADEIFQVSTELEEVLREKPNKQRQLFRVGIADVVPKSMAYHLLKPALQLPDPIRLVCREDKLTRLLSELAIHQLDLIIADAPQPFGMDVKGYSHKLGECGVTFLASAELSKKIGKKFPDNLKNTPLLLPGQDSALRNALMRWLNQYDVRANIVGEFDDSALMKSFGQAGAGVFPVPSAVADEVCQQFNVKKIGSTQEIKEQFYIISAERRLTHPAVKAVSDGARENIFSQ
jgi:LysR family transcriptional regulator, transcriptional activator of nhaA